MNDIAKPDVDTVFPAQPEPPSDGTADATEPTFVDLMATGNTPASPQKNPGPSAAAPPATLRETLIREPVPLPLEEHPYDTAIRRAKEFEVFRRNNLGEPGTALQAGRASACGDYDPFRDLKVDPA